MPDARDDDVPPETSRQRFIRNHDERIRIMRLAEKEERESGNAEDADAIASVIRVWERIGAIANQQETDDAD